MRYFIFLSAILLGGFFTASAQVGIGNAVPEPTSVLDLSNSTSKGLLLPSAASIAAMSATPGMIYFYDNKVYYRRTDGYNALSPWKYKFNGDISNNIYYNLGGNIGIGLSDITVSPLAPLHIETDNSLDLVDDGSFLIGKTTATSLGFNSTKIQSRDRGSASTLQINEQGGDVIVGSPAVPANVKTTRKVKELHQPTGEYSDVMPTGAIIMWSGSTSNIPTGWAMCDGADFDRSDNTGTITTPDLSGRFVVGAGSNGENTYSPHEQGGEDAVTLTEGQMPSHYHSGTTNTDGAHTHKVTADNASDIHGGKEADASLRNDDGDGSYQKNTGSAGSHNHTFTTAAAGSGLAHENRPKYYALIYIMKL